MATQELGEQIQQPIDQDQDGINLIEVITMIGEDKWTIFGLTFIVILAALAYCLTATNIYTAKTTILPPQQHQSSAMSALASLGGLAGLAGGSLGMKSSDEMYVAILKSATIQGDLVERFKLQTLYKQKKLSDARDVLAGNSKITADKKAGIITIEVNDKSPDFAAQLANSYVDELRKTLEHLAVTDAQQRRVFFENLIVKAKESLAAAELASKKGQETSGIVSLDAQTALAIKESAQLRAQISLREVQIQAMSSYVTPQNSAFQRITSELAALRAQLDKLEQGTGPSQDIDKSAGALANLRAFREVKYQQAVLETLIKQYELARVDEAREGPLVQQIDVATPPEYKSKPKRAFIMILAAMGGLVFGFLVAFVRRKLRKVCADAVSAESFKMMRQAWRIKTPN